MSTTAAIWAQLQAALLLLLPLCLLPQRLRCALLLRIAAPVFALVLAFAPLGDPRPAAWLYAYSGALSLPTLVLAANLASRRLWSLEWLPKRDRQALLTGAAVMGLLLYPMALGLGPFDPYGLGFMGAALPVFLGVAAATAWWQGLRVAALVLLAVLWSWLLGLGESQNLWDYLLDAWLWVYALPWLAVKSLSRFVTRT